MVNARNTINGKKKELEQAKKTLKEKEEEANLKFIDAENELAKARNSLDSLKDISWYVFDRTAKADYTQYYDDVQRVENIATNAPELFCEKLDIYYDMIGDSNEKVRIESPELFRVVGKRKPMCVKPYLDKLQWVAQNDEHRVVRIHCAGAVRITENALSKYNAD